MTTAPSPRALHVVLALAHDTLESLRNEHGQVIESDEEALAALVEEGVDLDGILRRLVACAREAEADAEQAKARMADLAIRKARFEHREEILRSTITQCLEALGLKAWKDAEATLSLRPGQPKVIVTDPDALPTHCVRSKTIITPDTAAIRAALEAGANINGAVLANASPILTIRCK